MIYEIHYTHVPATEHLSMGALVGVEFCPNPWKTEEAATNFAQALTQPTKRSAHAVVGADLTRFDEAGAAFMFNSPNRAREFDKPGILAHHLGALIDPCGLHLISYIHHEPRAGLDA